MAEVAAIMILCVKYALAAEVSRVKQQISVAIITKVITSLENLKLFVSDLMR